MERAELKDYTGRCNRHTFASRLVMAGVDLHTVGELLGLRTAQTTERYAYSSVNHNQAAVERISGRASAVKTARDGMKIPNIPGNTLYAKRRGGRARLNAPDSKSGILVRVSGVRIPPSPPKIALQKL